MQTSYVNNTQLYIYVYIPSLCLGFSLSPLFCILSLCVFLSFQHFPKFKGTLFVSSKVHAGLSAFRKSLCCYKRF